MFDDLWKYLVTMFGIGKMELGLASPPIAKSLLSFIAYGSFVVSVKCLLYPPACSVLSVLHRRDFRIFV
jgi:hypothetical protein